MSIFDQMSAEDRVLFNRESLRVEATEAIARAMNHAGVSKQELARRMGCSQRRVTAILDGGPSLTINSLADALGALGFQSNLAHLVGEAEIHFCGHNDSQEGLC